MIGKGHQKGCSIVCFFRGRIQIMLSRVVLLLVQVLVPLQPPLTACHQLLLLPSIIVRTSRIPQIMYQVLLLPLLPLLPPRLVPLLSAAPLPPALLPPLLLLLLLVLVLAVSVSS
jgi:hypothetical protein